jgi:hypothetical protein
MNDDGASGRENRSVSSNCWSVSWCGAGEVFFGKLVDFGFSEIQMKQISSRAESSSFASSRCQLMIVHDPLILEIALEPQHPRTELKINQS